MKTWLLDTGPLVAYLNVRDSHHAETCGQLDAFTGLLCTTSAVITEAMHLVSADRNGPAMLVEFLESSRTEIHELARMADLKRAVALMRKYQDAPMDFADATLVLLAENLKVTDVCSLDRRGFAIYRTSTGKRFHLVLTEP